MRTTARRLALPLAFAAGLLPPLAGPARACEDCDSHHHEAREADHHDHQEAKGTDPHAHHRAMAATGMKRAQRSTSRYALPAIELVRDDGKAVTLSSELADGKPVAIEFIFTTCTTICPIMSRTFSQLQERLGAGRDRVHLVSISIDPEQDTPERLAAYARKYGAGPAWRFYTGTTAASVAVQRAFDAYRGDKMSHTPLTLVRTAPDRPWVRIDGFATADELARELRERVASR